MVRRKRDKLAIALSVLAVVLASAGLTFYLWHLNEMTRLGYDAARLEEEINRLREDVRRLEIQKEELLSLDRVEGIARGNLGLTDPRPDQIRYRTPVSGEHAVVPAGASR